MGGDMEVEGGGVGVMDGREKREPASRPGVRKDMATAEAAAVAQDCAIDGFAQGGADGAASDAAAQAAQDGAGDGTKGRHGRHGFGADAHSEVGTGNGN